MIYLKKGTIQLFFDTKHRDDLDTSNEIQKLLRSFLLTNLRNYFLSKASIFESLSSCFVSLFSCSFNASINTGIKEV